MIKKTLKITIFITFVLVLFSSCVPKIENCKFLPKIELGSEENNESVDKNVGTKEKINKMIENRTTSATASCNF